VPAAEALKAGHWLIATSCSRFCLARACPCGRIDPLDRQIHRGTASGADALCGLVAFADQLLASGRTRPLPSPVSCLPGQKHCYPRLFRKQCIRRSYAVQPRSQDQEAGGAGAGIMQSAWLVPRLWISQWVALEAVDKPEALGTARGWRNVSADSSAIQSTHKDINTIRRSSEPPAFILR